MSLSIESLRKKFERRIETIKYASFESLQQALVDLWQFLDSNESLGQIIEKLLKKHPKSHEKAKQILNSPNSEKNNTNSESESVAISTLVLYYISESESNNFRGKLQVSAGSDLFTHQNLKQNELDEKFTEIFKQKYLSKFSNYIIEELEEIESENYKDAPNTTHILPNIDSSNLWKLLHPRLESVSKSLYESKHYADSVFSAMKEVNAVLKKKIKAQTGEELDGAKLMQKTFSLDKPYLLLGDITTQSGKDLQQGYQMLFSGGIIGVRNPKAHENLTIDENRAIHLLFLTSLLMHKIDEATIA